ncbi:MAG TPA: agmatine deiminase family protein [Solirubrobacteraceae bacterium]|jgi:agmatine deiminase|nr:agmatine deiminase family protein [Solirubrobacteraceae bacterium]
MPAEWAPHERTLMAWPTRPELWGDQLQAAREEYAATANSIAAFEPLTMVCANAQEVAQARAALTTAAEVVELPIDDSWLRDCGPIFVVDGDDRRAGVHFGFNSWGGKFTPWDRDAAVGALLVEHVGDNCYEAPFVLEGGAIAVDGEGTLLTTEECLLNPNRNPGMSREEIEAGLCDHLGVETIVWLGQGLVEDRDTDGHVDMIAAFTRPGEVLLQSVEPGAPSHERMADNRTRLTAAGLDVVDFPILAAVEVAGEPVAVSHLNLYLCNGAAIVPLADVDTDAEALERIAAAYPAREVVGVPGRVIAFGGGGPHCITQQVPAAG